MFETVATSERSRSDGGKDSLCAAKDTKAGTFALIAGNVAGLIDLVALPLWVGALVGFRHFSPAGAGTIVTLYLLGVLFSSLIVAPLFSRLPARLVAALGFAVGAIAFAAMAQTTAPLPLGALHAVAGIGAGCGLAVTHGRIGCTSNPHRIFAFAGLGVGIFAIAFFATAPGIVAARGASGLFLLLSVLLLSASLISAIAFPRLSVIETRARRGRSAVSRPAVLVFVAVACLATTESMVYSTVQGIGLLRGFTFAQIGSVLLVGGFVNLTAPLSAILLQRRLPPFLAAGAAIALHGCMAALVTVATLLVPWAVAVILMVWLILFGHNFIFGVIARLDPSGRTAASTPAMLMTGAAVGPALGGVLAQSFGYASLGAAAIAFAFLGTTAFAAFYLLSEKSHAATSVLHSLRKAGHDTR